MILSLVVGKKCNSEIGRDDQDGMEFHRFSRLLYRRMCVAFALSHIPYAPCNPCMMFTISYLHVGHLWGKCRKTFHGAYGHDVSFKDFVCPVDSFQSRWIWKWRKRSEDMFRSGWINRYSQSWWSQGYHIPDFTEVMVPLHEATRMILLENKKTTKIHGSARIWLVVWNMFYCSMQWEFEFLHPNWLSYFSEVGSTTNQE